MARYLGIRGTGAHEAAPCFHGALLRGRRLVRAALPSPRAAAAAFGPADGGGGTSGLLRGRLLVYSVAHLPYQLLLAGDPSSNDYANINRSHNVTT